MPVSTRLAAGSAAFFRGGTQQATHQPPQPRLPFRSAHLVQAAGKDGSKRRGGSSSSSNGGGGSSGAGARRRPKSGSAAPGGKAASKKQQQQQAVPTESGEQPALVPPIRMHMCGDLSTADRMPQPLWATFCGVSNGLWCGITAAYSPFTGEPEPVALDDARKPLSLLHQCCVEERVVDEESDCVVRHVARAATLEGLQREMVQGGQLQFPACSVDGGGSGGAIVAECWDEERIAAGQEGLVVFDGGSYSLGPGSIGSPAELPSQPVVPFDDMAALAAAAARSADDFAEVGDDEAAAEDNLEVEEEVGGTAELDAVPAVPDPQEEPELDWTTAVVEHCMQWGGEQRLRIRVTLDTAGGGDGTDLEIQPLRVTVSREAWEGLPGAYNPSQQASGAAERQEASRRVRLDTQALGGHWKVFEVTAVTVNDISMSTGLPASTTLYTAAETLRQLDTQPPEDGGDGALLRLPHSCGVQLETLKLDNQRRRGLRISTHWSPQPDMLLSMARLYDADGRLLEVCTSTAIKAE